MPSNDNVSISCTIRRYDNQNKQLLVKVCGDKLLLNQDQESCADKETLLFRRQWIWNEGLVGNMRMHLSRIIELSAGNVLSLSTNKLASRFSAYQGASDRFSVLSSTHEDFGRIFRREWGLRKVERQYKCMPHDVSSKRPTFPKFIS